jgi:type 1 glutamine amidotransferase
MRPWLRPPGRLALASLLAALGLAACRAPEPGPVRVLLLSGQNNHDWRSTTPKLRAILEAGGGIQVDVIEDPGLLTPRSLEPYDVILSNWNAFGREAAASAWPEPVRRAYLEFVRGGKGHVVVHAGSSSFPGWEDYARLTLAAWKDGQTSHGPRHGFPVRIDRPRHPVTSGLAPFVIADELWNKPGVPEGAEVLASSYSAPDKEGTGAWEPAVLAGRFGRGRSLTILLGHDAAAMDNPGFQVLLRRGVEWAATGRVTPPVETVRPGWRWEKAAGESLALLGPAGPLWQFRCGADLDTPYFHPLSTADGRTLTRDRPPDHIWHHGLWFSWKFINGVNYWEVEAKTGRPAGRTSWSKVRIETGSDLTARISMDLAYRPAGDEAPVLTEKRMIEARPPDNDGIYSLDWTCAFQAVGEVVLDRTPIPGEAGGQGWGGYAGLSLRLAAELEERQAVTSDGPVTEMPDGRYRGRHAAVDYSGSIGGDQAGVAILDHPGNPRFPTPWYVIRSAEMGFFSPAVLCYGPMTLRPGQRMTLRYRVIVHPGRWGVARLRSECMKFSSRTPGSP